MMIIGHVYPVYQSVVSSFFDTIFVTSLHKFEHVLTAVIDTSARVALLIQRSMCFRRRFWPRPLR